MIISSSDEYEAPDAELELDRVGRPRKAATAFRTISEVADDLHVPQHVLRFWETRFPQVKPLKRGGGRRYYRPDDVVLLRRISDLLYIQGYTIKGVQRLLREGDGTLQGDLPPPDVADRDGDDISSTLPPVRVAAERNLERVVGRPATSTFAMSNPISPLHLEARELRKLLLEVLGELEAIRAQLAV